MYSKVAVIWFLLAATLPRGEQQVMPSSSSLKIRPDISQLNPEDCPSASIRNGSRDSNTCKELFTSFGPLCSIVIIMDGNVQRCAGDYAEETCSFCLSLQQKCGSLGGRVSDICTSRNAQTCSFLRSSCSTGRISGPDCDYCEVIFTLCEQLSLVPSTAITEPTFCSVAFENIGPFCQYVLRPNNNEQCQAGFSTSTCSTCRNVLRSCNHSLVGDTDEICLSNMAFLCTFPQSDSTPFIVEYCSVVQALCSERLSGSAESSGSLSGSGVGSGSGSSGVSGSGIVSGSGSGLPVSGSGSGDQCNFVRNTFGHLCTAVLQSSTCELVHSRDTCDFCQLVASMCTPLDSNAELFCEQPFFDCETVIGDCFLSTESSFQCDYCAFYTNNCFSGREVELCDIKNLLHGCNRAFNTGYPCECFFTIEICTLCNNLQLICPPDITTTTATGPTRSTTLEPTTVSESTNVTLPVSSTTEETNNTEESTTTFPITSVVQPSTISNITTTTIPFITTTTPEDVPVVTLGLEDLTMSQQDNAVTTVFGGLEVDQFLENGITVFREYIASQVNTYEGNGIQRQKRQQAQVSPADVLLIGSPVMVDNQLLIAFVVVGLNGEPINGQILATILGDDGNQLASILSIATGVSVEFIGVVKGIDSAILQPLTTTSVTISQLPNGVIVAIVLIVVLITVLSIVFVLVITIVLVRQRSRRRKYNLDTADPQPKVINTYQAVDKLGVPVEDKEPLHQSDVCLHEKSEPLTVPPSVYIESNPVALEDDQNVQESNDAAKDTSI